MQDQEVIIKNNVVTQQIGAAPSVAPGGTIAAGTNLGIGNYQGSYSFISPDGESVQSPNSTAITTTSGNQKINWTGIAVGPTGTTGRRLYRTGVGSAFPVKLVTTINDNVTTTFADTIADASLGVVAPVYGSFGGSLIVEDNTSAIKAQFFNDGSLTMLGTLLSSKPSAQINGTSGNIQLYTPIWGSGLQLFLIKFSGYINNVVVSFTLPVPSSNSTTVLAGHLGSSVTFTFFHVGSALPASIITALGTGSASGTDTGSANTAIHGDSLAQVVGQADQVQVGTVVSAVSGNIIGIGTS